MKKLIIKFNKLVGNKVYESEFMGEEILVVEEKNSFIGKLFAKLI